MVTSLPASIATYSYSVLSFAFAFVVIGGIAVIRISQKDREFKKLKQTFSEREKLLSRKLYESRVLSELNERFGYSLDVEKVVDTVISSLQSLIPYSAASYILLDGNKLKFKSNIVEDVSGTYLRVVKDRMLASIKELINEDISRREVEETFIGLTVNDSSDSKVESFFNIPLVVNGDIVGLLNVSSTKSGLYGGPEVTLLYKIVEKATNAVARLQAVLDRERSKLEAMIEGMMDGTILIDKDFKLLVMNPSVKEMMGSKNAEKITIFDVVSKFDNSFPIEEMIASVYETGETKSISQLRFNGTVVQLSIFRVELSDEEKGIGLIFHDQSQEEELRKLREEFVAMMIHELRSPLTVILGTSDLLTKRKDKMGQEQQDDMLKQITSTAESLLKIVNDLLDAAKIESGKFEIVKQTGNINELLRQEVGYYENLANNKGLELEFDLDESVSDMDFDKMRITQVLNNLISNAIKFTSEGKITVVSKKDDGGVEISVIDTGTGISDKQKSKIFNKFVQAHDLKDPTQLGTGLGLVIAKGIVEAHGGNIWVEDNHPKGSVFKFNLPKE